MAVRRDRDLGWAILSKLYHLRSGVSLGASRAWCANGKRVVYTFYPPKCRRSFNPNRLKASFHNWRQ